MLCTQTSGGPFNRLVAAILVSEIDDRGTRQSVANGSGS